MGFKCISIVRANHTSGSESEAEFPDSWNRESLHSDDYVRLGVMSMTAMQRLNFAIKLVEAYGPSLGKVQAYLDKLNEKCTGLECVELQRLNDSQRPCRECCAAPPSGGGGDDDGGDDAAAAAATTDEEGADGAESNNAGDSHDDGTRVTEGEENAIADMFLKLAKRGDRFAKSLVEDDEQESEASPQEPAASAHNSPPAPTKRPRTGGDVGPPRTRGR